MESSPLQHGASLRQQMRGLLQRLAALDPANPHDHALLRAAWQGSPQRFRRRLACWVRRRDRLQHRLQERAGQA